MSVSYIANFEALGLGGAVFTSGKSGKMPYGQIKKYYRNTDAVINHGTNTSTNNKTEDLQFYYHPDHLGSSNYITDVSGEVYQHQEYFPFGETFVEERNDAEYSTFLFNGKELDEETGLYYYGARYYDTRIALFTTIDPHSENYFAWSPYHYAANNPIIVTDPNGKDWYTDVDGTYQYDPKINEKSKLQDGQKYVGATLQVKDKNGKIIEDYRSDGSIMYSKESSAYSRMWSQAENHYKREKEVGGFVLEDSRVLVYPDYANEKHNCNPEKYGYSVSNDGYLSKNGEKIKITGQIHTHQNPDRDATPSFYTGSGWGDIGYSKSMGGLPIMTIGHDGNIHGAFWSFKHKGYSGIGDLGTRDNLLKGKTKLAQWLKTYPTLK